MSTPSNIKGPLARDGSTIYELMHHGWHRGVEVFRNRWWITVQVDSTISNETSWKIARDIQNALESHADMLAALKPFAALLQSHMKGDDQKGIFGIVGEREAIITMGDLRRAVAAIAKAEGETK